MRVLGVITARGGSKGVPGKNIRPLGGKPLLVWTAEAALRSRRLSRVILSTDDDEIAKVAQGAGVDVPFRRPAELATDTAPTLPVLQHAVASLEKAGDTYDAICLLQPTNPLRTSDTIDGCIDMLEQANADSVVTVLPVPAEHNPHWVYFAKPDGQLYLATGESTPIPRRQELPAAYHREGSVYVVRRDVLMQGGSLYGNRVMGYMVRAESSVNIDDASDWERAEKLIGTRA